MGDSSIPAAFRFEQFNDYLTFERGLSPRTVSAYERDLTRWWQSLRERGVDDPAQATPELLREWVFALKEEGLAATSIRRAQSAVRTYFRFLLSEGVLDVDPSERLESPRVARKLPDFLTRDEVTRLLDAPDASKPLFWRDRAILELLYASGLRVSELTSLAEPSLLLETKLVRIHGRGVRERLVPMGSSAVSCLRRYGALGRPKLVRPESGEIYFLNARGLPLSRMTIWKTIRAAAPTSAAAATTRACARVAGTNVGRGIMPCFELTFGPHGRGRAARPPPRSSTPPARPSAVAPTRAYEDTSWRYRYPQKRERTPM